ncbi:hypothetical protein WJX73_009281 [Symbiochloris irregularis]|uniref:FAD dependent oxidoreductase domain-containing protein n=1 Tax=Symbiochloris irregularis TaxID=706552 RepID=A0AAW1PHP9_9CHLO
MRTRKVASAEAQNGSSDGKPDRVVICGGGIIGASAAFYLSQLGVKSLILEKCAIACASSGKAGGFLALDWQDGQATGPLSRRSFELHAELAKSLGQNCGYRRVSTLALSVDSSGRAAAKQKKGLPEWLDGSISGAREMGNESTNAQVHPELLTKALIAAAQAEVRQATVQGVVLDGNKAVTGVKVDGGEEECDTIVIAMGPWTGQARAWLPGIPSISGQKAHSIVVEPSSPIGANCLFMNHRNKSGEHKDPELYARPDGTAYICGEGESVPVPDDPLSIVSTSAAAASLQEAGAAVSSLLADGKVIKQQACYLPLSPDGVPVIGKVPGATGAFIATGHSCWGILNGPATGEALAELIVQGRTRHVSLDAFDPARFSGRKFALR